MSEYLNYDCINCGRHRVENNGICEKCNFDNILNEFAQPVLECLEHGAGTCRNADMIDALRAEIARRDEKIAELTATKHSQAFRNAELSRFVWWVYQVYARNVQELTSGITEACTYETEEKAEKGKYGLPIRCWEYIRYLEEYTAGIYNGTYLDSETSTVVKRDLSDFEINELGAQEAEKRGEK